MGPRQAPVTALHVALGNDEFNSRGETQSYARSVGMLIVFILGAMVQVKLIRVWRPLVSDYEMVELLPSDTVGQLKERFKDISPPSAVEVLVNGSLRGGSVWDEDPCAQDGLTLADGDFPENTIIHANCRDAKLIAEGRVPGHSGAHSGACSHNPSFRAPARPFA